MGYSNKYDEYWGGSDKDFDKAIADATAQWYKASAAGDKAGMDSAHSAAEAARAAKGYSGGVDGNQISVLPPKTQVSSAPPTAPTYTGPSAAEYMQQLIASKKSGVEQAANAKLNAIQNNLAQTLAMLEQEKAGVQPAYDKTVKKVEQTAFDTSERQKELMNMSGWNTTNSGLAIGELDKVSRAAGQDKDAAYQVLMNTLADIARRVTTANTLAGNDRQQVESDRAAAMAGAEADAMMAAENRNYNLYRDARSDYNTDRGFDYQQARDSAADSKWLKEFQQQQSNADRNYQYQADRDKVLDSRWLSQFDEQKRQSMVSEALQKRQISVSEANQALAQSRLDWDKSDRNPDNQYKQAQIKAAGQKETNTIGSLYSDMMQSGDPEKWIRENGQYLHDDELKQLYSMIPKKARGTSADLSDILKALGGN